MAKLDEEEFEELDIDNEEFKVTNKAKLNTSMLQASFIDFKRPKRLQKQDESKVQKDSKKHHPKSFNQLDGRIEKKKSAADDNSNGILIRPLNNPDSTEEDYFEEQNIKLKNDEPNAILCELSEPRWIKGDSLFRIDGYRDYTLKVTWDKAKPGEHKICMVQRRYTDFEWLQDKLLAKMSECAVPLLPDRSVYDKFKDNNSDFVKTRVRGLQHFMTIIISLQHLRSQSEVTFFLRENKETFKARLEKERKEREEEEKKRSQSSGWISSARNSFSGLFSRAKEATIGRISSYISNGGDNNDEDEQKINKIEENLNRLKTDFELIISNLENYCKIRYEEAQIDSFFNDIMSNRNEFEDSSLSEHLKKSSDIYEVHQSSSISCKNKVEEDYFYEAESNLVWIKSVISLLERRKQK